MEEYLEEQEKSDLLNISITLIHFYINNLVNVLKQRLNCQGNYIIINVGNFVRDVWLGMTTDQSCKDPFIRVVQT